MGTERKTGGTSDVPEHAARILEEAADAFVSYDDDWRFLYVNRSAEAMLRRPRADLLGRVVWEEYPESVGTVYEENFRRAARERAPVFFEAFYAPFDLWTEVRVYPSPGAGGVTVHLLDVTARKRAEEALRASEARLAGIISSAMDAIVSVDEDARLLVFNAAAERMFGYDAAEVLGRPLDRLLPAMKRGRHTGPEGYLAAFAASGIAHTAAPPHLFGRRKDGTEFPIEAGVSQATVDGRRVFTAVVRDATDRLMARRLRAEREAERAAFEAQQRRFMREVLSSVTGGRLRLCDGPGDLPLAQDGQCAGLGSPRDLAGMRAVLREAACTCGFSEARAADLLMAAGEAAMNAVVHGGGGCARVTWDAAAGRVRVRIEDGGAGIRVDALHRATLEPGYSSAGSLGHGFPMMIRTANRVWLLTGPAGTTVVLELSRDGGGNRDAAEGAPDW